MKREKPGLYYFLLRMPCIVVSIFMFGWGYTFNLLCAYFFFLFGFLLFVSGLGCIIFLILGIILIITIIVPLFYMGDFLRGKICDFLGKIIDSLKKKISFLSGKINFLLKKILGQKLRQKFNNWQKMGRNDKINSITLFTFTWILPILFVLFVWYDVSLGGGRECYDKTSIDYNRNNDMKCVNKKGDVKRTNYKGARLLMGITY